MIDALKKDLETYASMAPEYNRGIRNADCITLFANKYCDACDAIAEGKTEAVTDREIYYSALMLKFWDQAYRIYMKIKTANKDFDDAVDVLAQCIITACDKQNRAWRKNPEVNAQQAINQTIATRGIAAVMYESNLKKNKLNAQLISLDTPLDSDDDESDTLADQIADTNADIAAQENRDAYYFIQDFIDNNQIVEAIILDTIATQDVFKHDKETIHEIDEVTGEDKKITRETSKFWPFKVVQELNGLDKSYADYFSKTYSIAAVKLQVALEALSKATNAKKYKMLENTLSAAKCVWAM